MKRLILALLVLVAAAPVYAQQAVVAKAVDASTGATTDVGNATDHAIRVTQASGGTVWTFNWTQLLGAAPSATNPMPSRLTDGTTYIDPRSIRALTSADVVTVVQGTGSNLHVVVDTAPTTAVTGTFWQATQPVSGTVTTTPPANASTDVTKFGGTTVTIGQQLAAASIPVILPSATVTTLTPPAAITGFALEAGHLATIDTSTAKIPSQGQALAAASMPVVLPAAQITTLTPPAAITGFALDATLTNRTAKTIITDGTNDATVKAASTLPAATDKAVVVTLRESLSTPVTGPLTDTQLRATAVPVSLASAPTTAVTNAGLTNLDVALSTRTKPADQQHTIIDSGTTAVTQATGTNLHMVVDAGTAVFGALVANQSVNQTQLNGVAVSVGMGASDTGTQRFTLAQEPTYGAGMTAATATAAGTGIFWEMCGSASKTIRVQKLVVSGTIATAAKNADVVLTKHSAATTSGTATTLTQVPYDSSSAAGTATNVRFFTVLGTAGTSVGVIQNGVIFLPLTTSPTFAQPAEFVWRDQDSEAPTLRGTAQCLTLNFGTTPTNAPSLLVSVRWTEK